MFLFFLFQELIIKILILWIHSSLRCLINKKDNFFFVAFLGCKCVITVKLNELTKKKISIINPIGHIITKTWSNVQQEYMIDLTNVNVINIEITKEDIYEIPELVFRMKKGDDIRLTFETVDEARDCQLYLFSIISSL